MNYHVEHHLFPTVPYHALPGLHDAVKDQLIEPSTSIVDAYREIVPALLKQRRDPSWELPRELPKSANQTDARRKATFVGEIARTAVGMACTDDDGRKWIEVSLDSQLPIDSILRVDVEDATYAVYRTAAGLFASDGICTHSRRVHLADGVIVGEEIECPKHNGRFEIATGLPVRAPVCEALQTYEVLRSQEGSRIMFG